LGTHLIFAGLFDSLGWILNPHNWGIVAQVALGLGFVIFVHELGHFLVAKACGVKCEKFYLGFDIYGLKLCKFQYGETEYGIGILPLGGYVKMLGQDDNPYRASEEMQRAKTQTPHIPSGDLPPEPTSDPHAPYDPRSYMAQSVPERMAIISAGVIMNIIFAFLMATLAYYIGVKEMPCRLSGVLPGGAAWKANAQPGDLVIKIGDMENPKYDDLRKEVSLNKAKQDLEFVVQRNGQEKVLTLVPKNDLGVPMIGVTGPQTLEVMQSQAAERFSAADRAVPMLLPGDTILKVGNVEVTTDVALKRELVAHQGEEIKLTVQPPTPPAPPGSQVGKSEEEIAADDAKRKPAPIVVTIPPSPVKTLGIEMTATPITGVQLESPAAVAGFKVGDELVSIDGQPIGDPLTLADRLAKRGAKEETSKVVVRRDKKEVPLEVKLRKVTWLEDGFGIDGSVSVPALGIAYRTTPTVAAAVPGSPAEKAGIKAGDKITSAQLVLPQGYLQSDIDVRQAPPLGLADEETLHQFRWPAVVEALQTHHPRGTVRLTRATKDEQKPDVIELVAVDSPDYFNADRGIVLTNEMVVREVSGFGEASKLGYRKTVDSLLMVYSFLQRVWNGDISPRMLGGPVTIAQAAGQSAEQGFPSLLLFLTMLSANLAVVNFLPIPVLDGGHMVFLIYEGVTGKPPSEKVFVLLTYLGFAFVLTLMLFVLGLDFGFVSRW